MADHICANQITDGASSHQCKVVVLFRSMKVEFVLERGMTVRHVKELILHDAEAMMDASDLKLIFKGKQIQSDDEELFSVLHLKKLAPKKVIRMVATGRSSTEVHQWNQTLAETKTQAPRLRDDLTKEGQAQLLYQKRLGQSVLQKASRGARKNKARFGKIETLPGLPQEHKAPDILSSLANDPGIIAVMENHGWNVGSLAELYPKGKVGESAVCVMGLNENKGQRILLRIRTDDLQGFRKILSIRKVLFHELAHNVHSDHDGKFFQLMRTIEQEYNAMEWTNATTTSATSSPDAAAGMSHAYSGGIYRLGGGNATTPSQDNNCPILSPRERAAQAAMARLTAEEEEIQQNCGCGREDLFLPKSSTASYQNSKDHSHTSMDNSN